MKLGKKKLAVLMSAALGLGVAGQASADTYGLSSLQIDGLSIVFAPISGAGAGAFTFATNASAILNGASAGGGLVTCGGIAAVVNDCNGASPRLSSPVQNAPGSGETRLDNNYTPFGQTVDYSNAESAIITAQLLGDATTSTGAISESNLANAGSAAASTNVESNTALTFAFSLGAPGSFTIGFNALLDVFAEVSDGDLGIAQANSGFTLTLQQGGVTLASWAPDGTGGALNAADCGPGLTCVSVEAATNLNVSRTSGGAANTEQGGGFYQLAVNGLQSGDFTLALATTTSTQVQRFEVPVPGTLMLFGTGLLLGARSLRQKKA